MPRATKSQRKGLFLTPLLALTLCAGGCTPEVEPPRTSAPNGDNEAVLLQISESIAFASLQFEVARMELESVEASAHLGEGWAPESAGQAAEWIWATGIQSTLEFYLDEARPLDMSARCWPFHFPNAPMQSLSVQINERPIARFEMERGPNDYAWRVDAEALRPGRNVLKFEYGGSHRPIDVLPGSADRRSLSIACDGVELGTATAESPARAGAALVLPARSRIVNFAALPPASAFVVDRIALAAKGSHPAATLRVELAFDDGHASEEWVLDLSEEPQRIELISDDFPGADRIAQLSLQVLTAPASPGDVTLLVDGARIVAPFPASAPQVASQPQGNKKPNVLILLVDTLRAKSFHAETAPKLSAFAETASRFENARANAPWTRPGVASVLTGLTPWQHGANEVDARLSPKIETLAELLEAEGYETGAIITNGNINAQYGFEQGFQSFDALPEDLSRREVHVSVEQLRAAGFDWLRARGGDRPFFLYLHATDPHAPYAPPVIDAGSITAAGLRPEHLTLGFVSQLSKGQIEVEDGVPAILESLYDALVRHVDRELGSFLEDLDTELGLLDNTLVILTSDHGEEFYEHGWWQHGKTLYDEQLHIPLVIRFPGRPAEGSRRTDAAQQIDIAPTVLSAAGIQPPRTLLGRDLAQPPPARGALASVALLDKDHRQAQSIVVRGFKLIEYGSYYGPNNEHLPTQLFDLTEDPNEERNLARARPILTGYLSALLHRSLEETPKIEASERIDLSPESETTLRALGYIE